MPGSHGTVLVTGFDPLGGRVLHPALLVAHALHRRQVALHRIIGAELPAELTQALEHLDRLLLHYRPTLVLCLGLSNGRATLRLERAALNRKGTTGPGKHNRQAMDPSLIPGAPAAYLSTLPIESMQRAMTAAGVPTNTSQAADSPACNRVFFELMHQLATSHELSSARGGFIHLPFLPEQGRPNMPLTQMVHGVRTGIRVALTTFPPPVTSPHAQHP